MAPASARHALAVLLIAATGAVAGVAQNQGGHIVLSPIADATLLPGPENGGPEAPGTGVDKEDSDADTVAALARTITNTLELSLRLAAASRVELADFIFPHVSLDRARYYYEEVGAAKAVYGSIAAAPEGGYRITAGLWTSDVPDAPSRREYRVESVPNVLDVADEIAIAIASEVVGRDLSFGTVRIDNTDRLPRYGVYVDGNLIARNQREVRVLAGTREVIVARPGELGDEPIQIFSVTVPQGRTVAVTLESPDEESVDHTDGPPSPATADSAGSAGGSGASASGVQQTAALQRTGRLIVETAPEGADVLLDDRVIGTTPLNRFGVPEGRYELVVRRPWFRPVTRVVDVTADQESAVTVDMEVDPDHPEVAEHLVNPGMAGIAGLGMTALQAGVSGLSPFMTAGGFPGDAAPIDAFIKAGLVRPSHLIAAPEREAAIVSGLSFGLSAVTASTMVYQDYLRHNVEEYHKTIEYRIANITSVVGGLGVFGLELYDLAFAPSAARRRNAATLGQIRETGSLPAPDNREPSGITVELGGNAPARVGYTFRMVRYFLYGHASLGATLTGVEPVKVGPALMARAEWYPLGHLSGATRPYLAPTLLAESDLETLGVSAGYDFGVKWLTSLGNYSLGSRALWGLTRGVEGLSFYAGVQM
ncbi:MAG: PEGA domain-containing protein [bacterium]